MAQFPKIILVLLLALACTGCGGAPSYSEVSEADLLQVDFVGVLLEAEPAIWGNPAEHGFTAGGPDSGMLVGPGTLRLTNGLSFEVPEGTPGGNLCGDLGENSLANQACIVFGELSANGDVAWFQARTTGAPQPSVERVELYTIGRVEGWHEDRLVVSPGIALPVTNDLRFTDCESDDGDPNPGSLTAPTWAVGLVANINHDGEIATLICLQH